VLTEDSPPSSLGSPTICPDLPSEESVLLSKSVSVISVLSYRRTSVSSFILSSMYVLLLTVSRNTIDRSVDSPRYYLGHGVVIGFVALGFFFAPLYAFLLKRANTRKERLQAEQDALPDHEKRVYTVQELRDMGDRYVSTSLRYRQY